MDDGNGMTWMGHRPMALLFAFGRHVDEVNELGYPWALVPSCAISQISQISIHSSSMLIHEMCTAYVVHEKGAQHYAS